MNTSPRNLRAQNAQQTLDIIEKGFYEINNQTISLAESLKISLTHTTLYTPDSFAPVFAQAEALLASKQIKTRINIQNTTTMAAAQALADGQTHLGCLNFASAKNPGGGFLGGAQAQEESLARASTLYPTQMKYFSQMYEYNRKQNTYLYSDYMIFSPDVLFFKDDQDNLLETPYKMDVLTSPAVNIGAMKQNRPQEQALAREVMMARLDKILSIFVVHGVENLVLGAWGCGVFQNDPQDVAEYFAHFLIENGKYAQYFNNITFAVLARGKETKNIEAFESVF